MDNLESRKRYLSRWTGLKSDRSSFDSHYKELAQFTQPRLGRFQQGNHSKGGKVNDAIIDSHCRYALRTLKSGMMAGVTSPARPWFRLGTPDPDLGEFGPVKDWLATVLRVMQDTFRRSNLYNALPRLYEDQGLFGTAAMMVMPDDQNFIRFYNYAVGSYALATDHRGVVNTFYRECQMTAAQIVEQFDKANISQSVLNMYDKNPDAWVPVMHAVEPNRERDVRRIDNKNMAFHSCWFETGGDSDKVLLRSGYNQFPVLAPRWDLQDEDVYGYSPAMEALGDNKQLQLEQRRKAQNIDKMTNPPMNAPSSMRTHPVSQLPGHFNYYDTATGGTQISPAIVVNPNSIPALREDIMDIRDRISRAFYEDLFLSLTMSNDHNKTAREVEELHEEKLLMLGPVLERQQEDLLDPLIDITFNMMIEQSSPIWKGIVQGKPLLPPPPKELGNENLKVEYISILAQAQKAVGLKAIEQVWQFAGGIAAAMQDPSVLNKLDPQKSIERYADFSGVDPSVVRTDDDVQQMQQAQQQQQSVAQGLAATQQGAQAAKDIGTIKTEKGNPIGDIIDSIKRG